jgi:hypothetical protein
MSRVFDHPNMINFECPVCRTSCDCEHRTGIDWVKFMPEELS